MRARGDHKDAPADVARDGFEAMMKGEERVLSHAAPIKGQGIGGRLLPDSIKAKVHGRPAGWPSRARRRSRRARIGARGVRGAA